MYDYARPPVNYKTIKLSRGKHAAPHEGACVMELASMIAGEPFTDQPRSVSPVIGALLRVYNDSLEDERRQDLYRYAVAVLGTRATPEVEQRRIDRCMEWARDWARYRSRWWHSRLLGWLRFDLYSPGHSHSAASAVVKAIGRRDEETHAAVLALIDELCAIGASHTLIGQSAAVAPVASDMPEKLVGRTR